MKKSNILLVAIIICFSTLTGSAFGAGIQDKQNILAYSSEMANALNEVLTKNKDYQDIKIDTLNQIEIKLAKVKQQYPSASGEITAVSNAIKITLDRLAQGGAPEFVAQNLIDPLESRLSPALIGLKNKDSNAFCATMNIIDIKYPTYHYSSKSLSQILTMVDSYMPEISQINDREGLIYSLTADSLKDAMFMLDLLKRDNPSSQVTIQDIKEELSRLVEVFGNSKSNESFYGQNLEGALETLERTLSNLKVSNEKLFNSIIGTIDRQYNTKNGKATIADMVLEVNEIFQNLPPTALVKDPQHILGDMNAYLK